MSQPPDKSRFVYVYRRAAPHQTSPTSHTFPDVFVPGEQMKHGLSVYAADRVTPRGVLQAMIDDWQEQLQDEERRDTAAEKLRKNPDVPTLVQKGWRVIRLAVADIEAIRFQLGQPNENGHLNILGERSQFKEKRLDFVELVNTGKARILSEEECLAE